MTKSIQGVTVVMPAYNSEKTIGDAIESVLAQTYTDFELIVVDDCSKDRTAEVVQGYVSRDPRVRLICNEINGGVSKSRNRAVQEASNDWIAFLDSDDCWTCEKLEEQLRAAEQHPECKLFFTATDYISEDGDHYGYILHVPEKVTFKDVLKQNVVSCSSVLVAKEMLLKYPMPDLRHIHEDLSVWLKILSETPYAVGIDKPMLIYRISASAKSGNKVKAAKMQWRTYRYNKVPFVTSVVCFAIYAFRNIKKYFLIKN